MARADRIVKLNVRLDERTVAPVETGGHISYFFRTFSAKFRDALLTNLVYSLIFALPLLFSVFVLPTLALNYVMDGKSFIGNLGIGFPNVADNLNEQLHYLMWIYRILIFPCNIFSIFLAFIGASGLFHVSRGLMWGEKVKLKSFFRGIKQLWKPFMLTGAAVAALSAALMYGLGWQIEGLLTGTDTAGGWVLFAVLLLVGLAAVMYLIFLLPTFACYRFSLKESLQNAGLLVSVVFVPTLIVAIIVIGLPMLGLIGNVMSYLVGILMFSLGFMFFSMMITTYAQYIFDTFIVPQVDPKNPGKRRDIIDHDAVAKSKKKKQDAKHPYGNKQPSKKVNYGKYNPNKKKSKKR